MKESSKSIMLLRTKVLNKMNFSDNIKIYAGVILIAILIIQPVYIAIVSNLESYTPDMLLIIFYINPLLWIGFSTLVIIMLVLITREYIKNFQKIWKPILGFIFSLLFITANLWQIFGFKHLESDLSDVNIELWGGSYIVWGFVFAFFIRALLKVEILPQFTEAPKLFHWIGLIYLLTFGISTILYGAFFVKTLPPFFSMIYTSFAIIGNVAQVIVGFGLILGGLNL